MAGTSAGARKAAATRQKREIQREDIRRMVAELNAGKEFVWGGNISLQRLDEDYNPAFKNLPKKIDLYDKMVGSDAKVASQLQANTLPLVSAVRWGVEGGSALQQELLAANLLRQGDPALWCETSWLQRLNESMRQYKYGFAAFGKTIERVGTYLIYRRLTYLHPKSFDGPTGPWEWNKQGTRLVAAHRRYKRPDGTMVVDERIPIEDIFLAVWDLTGENWEGVSMLRSMYRAWVEKDILSRVGMIDAQNRGVGIPDAELGPNDQKADRDMLVEIAKGMRGGSPERKFIVRANGQKIGFLTSSGNVVDTAGMILARNGELASAGGTNFMEQGQTASGSRATGSVMMVSHMQELEARKVFLQDQINHGAGYLRGLSEELQDMNFRNVKEYARIVGTCVSPADQLDNVPNILDAIQKGGMLHDLAVENHVRKAMHVAPLDQAAFDKLKAAAQPKPLGGRPPEVGDFDREDPRDDREGRRYGLREAHRTGCRGVLAGRACRCLAERAPKERWRPLTALEERCLTSLDETEATLDGLQAKHLDCLKSWQAGAIDRLVDLAVVDSGDSLISEAGRIVKSTLPGLKKDLVGIRRKISDFGASQVADELGRQSA